MQRKTLLGLASVSAIAIASLVQAQQPATRPAQQPAAPAAQPATRPAQQPAAPAAQPAIAPAAQAQAPAATPAAAPAPAERLFRVRDDGGSRVTFVSDAPLETIDGVTSKVTGEFHVNPQNTSTTRGTISVPVSSIRTGIDLRDEHLRGANWLDAAHHPNATFEIVSVSGARQLRPNREHRMTIRGRFTIHGVTREVTATARVKWLPISDELRATPGITSDVVRVNATFTITLTDYNISVPAIVRLKVANEIAVTVNLRAQAE